MSYYLKHNAVVYMLDATTDISVTRSGQTTSHPTASRKRTSDNYILDNPKATLNGVITDIKLLNSQNPLKSGEYLDELDRLMEEKVFLSFKYRLDGEEEDFWLITSLNYRQDQTIGYGGTDSSGNVVQSFTVSMSLEREVPSQGVVADVEVPETFKLALGEKDSSSKSLKQFDEEDPVELDEEAKARAAAEFHKKQAFAALKEAAIPTSPEEEE